VKINTREKLQILMFGLHAGHDLRILPSRTVKKCAIFSNLDDGDIRFHLAEDGTITASQEDVEDYSCYYQTIGCIEHAKQEANELFLKIK
jgi:hypothetical protein